jgi:uncharacterized protein
MGKNRIDPKIMKVIRFFIERLQEDGIKVSRIVVFGSQVGGATHKYSDIELIVVSENFRRKNLFKRVDMIYSAYSATIDKFVVPMDIVLETPEEFNPDFGVVVYAA